MTWTLWGIATANPDEPRVEMVNCTTGLRERIDKSPEGAILATRRYLLICSNCQAWWSEQTRDHMTWCEDLAASRPDRVGLYAAAAAHGWDTWTTAKRNHCPECVNPSGRSPI